MEPGNLPCGVAEPRHDRYDGIAENPDYDRKYYRTDYVK